MLYYIHMPHAKRAKMRPCTKAQAKDAINRLIYKSVVSYTTSKGIRGRYPTKTGAVLFEILVLPN